MRSPEEMSGTNDCGGNAAAYLLGALEPDEAQAFQRHLEGCAVCRDEVDALRGVVQTLPMAASQYPVPRRLRRRVMRAVRTEPMHSARRWPAWMAPARLSGRPALAALAAAVVVAAGVIGGLEPLVAQAAAA